MIQDGGVSVWLRADLDLLWQRVRHKATRPLLRTANPRETLRTIYEARVPIYALADLAVDSLPDLSVEAMAQRVAEALADAARTCWKGPEMLNMVPVALGARSYDVRIGTGLIDALGAEIVAACCSGARWPSSPTRRWRRSTSVRLAKSLEDAGIAMTALALPPGEATKGWAQFTRCVEWLLGAEDRAARCRGGLWRRGDGRSGGLCRRRAAARGAVRADPDDAAGAG